MQDSFENLFRDYINVIKQPQNDTFTHIVVYKQSREAEYLFHHALALTDAVNKYFNAMCHERDQSGPAVSLERRRHYEADMLQALMHMFIGSNLDFKTFLESEIKRLSSVQVAPSS